MSTYTLTYSHNLDEAVANRRGAFRHSLAAPLRLESQEGFVCNLSTRGLYFVTPCAPRPGSLVELEIALPQASPSGPLECRVFARVLRVDELAGGTGVAAEIEAWRMPEVDPVC